MIENLSKHNLTSIKKQVQKTIVADILNRFPKLKTQGSIVLIGSLSYGLYDDQSDIDLSIVMSEKLQQEYAPAIKAYKDALKKHNRQVQIFYTDTYEKTKALGDWHNDMLLRQYAYAIILHDPNNRYSKLRKQLAWYPSKVYQEKIQWLFAEAVFEFKDRFETAIKRKDVYYGAVSKLRFLQLIMTLSLLLNKQYPIYDKHLYRLQRQLRKVPKNYSAILENTVKAQGLSSIHNAMEQLMAIMENELLRRKLIPKKDEWYWIDLRPKYRINLK